MRTLTIALLLAGVAAAPAAAQQDTFNWHGRIPAGQAIEIKGVNGYIHATAATGDEVQVTADKHGRRSDPKDVKIQVAWMEPGLWYVEAHNPGDQPVKTELRSSPGWTLFEFKEAVELPPGTSRVWKVRGR